MFLALDDYDAEKCSCGMARSVCRDDSHRWQVVADVCGPSAALARFHKDHEELPDGLMLGVRLLADGEESTDPIRALELADLAAVIARHSSPDTSNQDDNHAGRENDKPTERDQ